MGLVLFFACWLATRLFSDRAAFLHVGAVMGSIMAGNVFLGIIPSQKRFVAAVEQGLEPSADDAAFAKQRSKFNNYFTLPVLFCMISNHYPFLYGHSWNWFVLAWIIATTAWARHFFNLRQQGIVRVGILIQAFAAFLLLAVWLGYGQYEAHVKQQVLAEQRTSETEVLAMVTKHCTNCHAASPTQAGFAAAPGGIILESLKQVRQHDIQIRTAVTSGYMPLANMTGMTEDEKGRLMGWLGR
jgi:uncharacterized membrane protein